MAKYLDDNGLLYLWGKIKGAFVLKDGTKVLSANDLTNILKTNYDAAYTHSQSDHAPSNAEQNVQADWNQSTNSADDYIKNKPTIPTVPTISSTATDIKMDGTQAAGSSGKIADASHVHPSDTTREPVISTKNSAFNKNYEATVGNIKMDGTASVGSADTIARGDHVHPTDTGRAAASHTHTVSQVTDIASNYVAISTKGQANGVASLDASGLIPSNQLPSYVDDVIELVKLTGTAPATCATGDKYFNSTSSLIFTATGTNTWGGGGVAPSSGVIYVDVSTNVSYRWGTSVMVAITSSDVVAITNAEIDVVVAS